MTISAPRWTGRCLPLGGFWLARGMSQEGCDWTERAITAAAGDAALHAELLRLEADLLIQAGDLDPAQLSLTAGDRIAAAAGLAAQHKRAGCSEHSSSTATLRSRWPVTGIGGS